MSVPRGLVEQIRRLDQYELRRLLILVRGLLVGVDGQPEQEPALPRTLSYRQELVRCGKEHCRRCPHGPYWYGYWKEDGRTRKCYIGRHLPGDPLEVVVPDLGGAGRRAGALAGALAGVVKAYDIRGRVDVDLDVGLCRALGAAAAEVLGEPGGAMVVGRDMRPSSPALAEAFAVGVTSRGLDVVDIGLASTDQLYFASGRLDLPGAVVTASHNPAEYNGLKLCRAGAAPVSIDTGLAAIRDLAAAEEALAPVKGGRRGRVRRTDVTEAFLDHVRSFVDLELLDGVRVAVDAGNGMAGHLWSRLVAGTGLVTTPLYFELDGTFPNHPANPLDPANLRDLRVAMQATPHAMGLAFDGDADRVFALDETGRAVSSSTVGAAVAERLLVREPGATVLYNLICSRSVPEVIEAAGGVGVRTRVGHSFIKQQMAQTGALFALEHSGHFYFRDNYRADSGLIAALLLLEVVGSAGRPLSEVLAPYERYVHSGELSTSMDDVDEGLATVRDAFAQRGRLDDLDGLTVELADGWFNLRASNTEPVVRLNVEGDDHAAMVGLRDEVLALLAAGSGA